MLLRGARQYPDTRELREQSGNHVLFCQMLPGELVSGLQMWIHTRQPFEQGQQLSWRTETRWKCATSENGVDVCASNMLARPAVEVPYIGTCPGRFRVEFPQLGA